ncbi:DUF4446 family protein [Patescibacteria group bacterium]|nr:DUF4446 family protein [Patescibacteria group bacterium]
MSFERIFFILGGAWLLGLSLGFYWLFRLFKRLTKGTKEGNLVKVLEGILAEEKGNKDRLEELTKQLRQLEDLSEYHIQRVGMVRFNPFKDLGGDHSFSIALLDAKDTGLVITGLHTRERTRVYVKAVKKGKAEHEFSEEEKKALNKAKKR